MHMLKYTTSVAFLMFHCIKEFAQEPVKFCWIPLLYFVSYENYFQFILMSCLKTWLFCCPGLGMVTSVAWGRVSMEND